MLSRVDAMHHTLTTIKNNSEGNVSLTNKYTEKEDLNLLDDVLEEAIQLGYIELVETEAFSIEAQLFYTEPILTNKGLHYLILLNNFGA